MVGGELNFEAAELHQVYITASDGAESTFPNDDLRFFLVVNDVGKELKKQRSYRLI